MTRIQIHYNFNTDNFVPRGNFTNVSVGLQEKYTWLMQEAQFEFSVFYFTFARTHDWLVNQQAQHTNSNFITLFALTHAFFSRSLGNIC